MADNAVQFELVSPEKLLLSRAVDMVVVPGAEGDMGVLPRHSPTITTVRPGTIVIYEGGAVSDRIFIAGGFAEVSDNRCTVLAEEALPVEDIDKAVIREMFSQQVKDQEASAKSAKERVLKFLEGELQRWNVQVATGAYTRTPRGSLLN